MLKHLCSLKLVSILKATLWKILMKCKNLLFFTFGALFLKIFIFKVAKVYLIQYQIPNQLNFLEVVCICKIYVFNGVVPCQITQNFWNTSPLLHGFLWKKKIIILEIWKSWKKLASSFKHFRIYGKSGKLALGMPRLTF